MNESDFEEALNAIEEMMVLDKGASEDEWIEWCNKYLPLMKRHGRMKNVVGWS